MSMRLSGPCHIVGASLVLITARTAPGGGDDGGFAETCGGATEANRRDGIRSPPYPEQPAPAADVRPEQALRALRARFLGSPVPGAVDMLGGWCSEWGHVAGADVSRALCHGHDAHPPPPVPSACPADLPAAFGQMAAAFAPLAKTGRERRDTAWEVEAMAASESFRALLDSDEQCWRARAASLPASESEQRLQTDRTAETMEGAAALSSEEMPPLTIAASQPRRQRIETECLRPVNPRSRGAKYGKALLGLALEPGRACPPSSCGSECLLAVEDDVISADEAAALSEHAANVLSKEATRNKKYGGDAETSEPTKPIRKAMVDLSRSARFGETSGHLLLVRVLERMRRLAADTFSITRSRIRFASHFVSKITADRPLNDSAVHCDQASFSTFHLSGVLWLGTHGEHFGGGRVDFYRNSTEPWLRVEPRVGRLALFTSGWEHLHRVEPVSWGDRWSLPVFMETLAGGSTGGLDIASSCLAPRSTQAVDQCIASWNEWF